MDPIRNPYAPGAGTPPPELAGRDELREQVHIAIERIRLGRASKSVLGRTSQSLAPTRAKLIGKGMVWSPSHGDTAFTVPLFEQFMQRIMPRLER